MGIRETILTDGQSACWILRGAFASMDTEEWLQRIPWQRNSIKVYGKEHLEPRLTAWMGPAYRYSSIQWPTAPFTAEMRRFVKEVESVTQSAGYFNACLFNQYRNGEDSMGWHRDNEPEIDPASIASLSLGATRTFKVRDRRNKKVTNIELEHGDLLVMEHLQEAHDHSVPKRTKVATPRMNFTFRRLV